MISVDEVDGSKKVVQLGMYKSDTYLNKAVSEFSKYDLITECKGELTTLYAVNLNSDQIGELKKAVSDSFEVKDFKIAQNEQKKEYVPVGIDKFQEAVFLYKNKKYAEALELFNELSNSMINSKKIDFYVGRCSYESADYDMALAAYERVLINEPDNLRVKLEIAQTYLKMNMLKEAKKEYEAVLAGNGVPDVVKANIEKQLAFIESKTQKNFITVMGIFGIGYDSNINSHSDEDIVNLTLNGTIFPSSTGSSQSAVTTEAGFVLNHIYKINEKFVFQNSATLYGLRYNHHEEMNMGILSLNTTPTYVEGKNMYATSLKVDHVWYGGRNYLNSYSIMPKFTHSIDKNILYDLYVNFSRKSFYDNDAGSKLNDSNTYELSNKLSYIDEKMGMFRGELLLGRESRKIDDSSLDTISKEYYTLSFANTYSINKQNALNTAISGTQYWYKDTALGFSDRRQDNKYSISAGVMNSYSKNLTLNLNLQYINQTSNITMYDYNKYTIKSYVYYSF
jgi:tetratricopeptide (TPR) repeat protein